jgi:hypothetical protein
MLKFLHNKDPPQKSDGVKLHDTCYPVRASLMLRVNRFATVALGSDVLRAGAGDADAHLHPPREHDLQQQPCSGQRERLRVPPSAKASH